MKVFRSAKGLGLGVLTSGANALGLREEVFSAPAAKAFDAPMREPVSIELRILWQRELFPEEAKAILAGGRKRAYNALGTRLRARHHAIARMLVAGASHAEIARIIGVSPLTIQNIMDSPAFMALYAEYAAMADAEAIDLRTRMQAAAGIALDEMTRRLIEVPESIPTRELRDTTAMLLDRIGHGPSQKVESVSTILTLEDIRQMKEQRKHQVVIDSELSGELSGEPSSEPAQ